MFAPDPCFSERKSPNISVSLLPVCQDLQNQVVVPTIASQYSHLFSGVLWMFLKGPGDSGLKGFGNALQEGAASLDSVQLLLSHAMLVVV